MKKKILMVGPALSVRGGMSSVAIAIIDNLSSDFEVEFLSTYVEGGKIRAGMAFLSAMRRIKRLARNADVVHIHFSKRGSTFRKAALAKAVKSVGTPLLLHSHSSSYGFYDELPDYGKQRVRDFLGTSRPPDDLNLDFRRNPPRALLARVAATAWFELRRVH